MLEYPPPIDGTHFKDPLSQPADDDGDVLVSRRSDDSDRVTLIAHNPCGVDELTVEAPGRKLTHSFVALPVHGVIPSLNTPQRLAFAPIRETLRVKWKLRGASSVHEIKLEIFRRSVHPEAAVWTKTLRQPTFGFLRKGELPFDGDLSTGDGPCPHAADFPDDCLTVEHSPYKLKITLTPIQPTITNNPPERWVYLDVLVHAIELEWGDAQVLPNRADVTTTFQWTPKNGVLTTEALAGWVLQQEKDLLQELRTKPVSKNRDVEIPCDAHAFCTDVAQWNDDSLYRSHRELWKEGPRLPVWARVLVRSSRGKGVEAPRALGNARFLWDWEDRGQKVDTWCTSPPKAISRTFLEDSLDYLVAHEWEQRRQPEASDNCHRNRGGKRGEHGAPVFPAQNPANYARAEAALRAQEFPFKVDPQATRRWAAYSTARTRGVLAGMTGAIFQPSRMAGDSYRISVYFLYDDAPNNEHFLLDRDAVTMRASLVRVPYASSGWFTMWRKATVHVLRKAKAPLAKPAAIKRIYEEAGIRLDFRSPVTIAAVQWQAAVDSALAEIRAEVPNRAQVSEWSVLLAPQSAKDDNAITMLKPREIARRVADLENASIVKIWTTFVAGNVAAGDRVTAGVKAAEVFGIGADAMRAGTLVVIAVMDAGHPAIANGDTINVLRTGSTFTIANAADVALQSGAEKTQMLSGRFRAQEFKNLWVNPSQALIQLAGRYYVDAALPNGKGIFLFQFRSHYRGEVPMAPGEGWAKAIVSTPARELVFGTSNSDWEGSDVATQFPGRPRTTAAAAHRGRDEVIAHEIGHAFFLPHTSGGNIGDAKNELHVAIENPPKSVHEIDNRDHCLMNYHPLAARFCGFCILRLRGWSAFGVNDVVNADNTLPLLQASFRNRADGTPTITPERPVVIVQKHRAANQVIRTKVEIRVSKPFAGVATVTSTGTNIVFSTNPDGTGPLTVHQVGGQTFAAALINDFHPIYAEATGAGPVTLTLDDGAGHTATADLLGVELTLELHTARIGPTAPVAMTDPSRRTVGRYVHVQDPKSSHARAKVVVKPPAPNTFSGNLVLSGSRVKLFANEVPAVNEQPLPAMFPAPTVDQTFWIEGSQASAADLEHFDLGAEGIPGVGDWVSATVVQLTWKATVPCTPERTTRNLQGGATPNTPARLEMTSTCASLDFDTNVPLVMLKGTADAATGNPVSEPPDVEAAILPAGLVVRWARQQLPGDPGTLPTLTPDVHNALKASFKTDGVGAFHLHAYVDTNNNNTYDESKPSAVLNVVLVEATLVNDTTTASSANCVARHHGDDIELSSGVFDWPTASMKFKAKVKLVGGGANRRLGLKQVFGGWINNIVSDDTAAIYARGDGHTIEARALYMHDRTVLASRIVPAANAPLLDTGRNSAHAGGTYATLGSQRPELQGGQGVDPHVQATAGGWKITLESIDSPGTGFDIVHKIENTLPNLYRITTIWMDTRFRAYLCLWTDMGSGTAADSKPARQLFGVLRKIPWRVRGRYTVDATGVAPVITPVNALVVSKQKRTTFSPMATAAATDIEVRPPNPHVRPVDFDPVGGTITRIWPGQY